MHIWYIHPYAGGPGIGRMHRPYFLARGWQKAGHTVTVIVAANHHLLSRSGPLPEWTHVDGVPYLALAARGYTSGGVGRLLNMFDFCRSVRRLKERPGADLPPPDAIIVSSPHPFPVYAAEALCRHFKVPLVFEIRDIWPLSITEILGVSAWHPFVQLVARVERFAYSHADLIASLSPRVNEHVAKLGFGEVPFVWAPNGLSTEPVTPLAEPGENTRTALDLIAKWHAEGRTVVVHPGSMGPPNGLIELMDAVSRKPAGAEAEKLAVLLVGSGVLESELRRRAASANCPVAVVGEVSRTEVGEILAHCDIGYAGVRNVPNLYCYGTSLNKFADYMLAGLPNYLPIAPCGDPVSEANAGIAEATATPSAMCDGLLRLARVSPEDRRAMGERGRRYMLEHYDFDTIAARYAEAIQRVRNRPQRG
jgi:glycosyltransferase involved in cell wall biosynthesis